MEKIKCPDCDKELDEVLVERFSTKTFKIDYGKKQLIPSPGAVWDVNDYASHCPRCDSLNVDALVGRFAFMEDKPTPIPPARHLAMIDLEYRADVAKLAAEQVFNHLAMADAAIKAVEK